MKETSKYRESSKDKGVSTCSGELLSSEEVTSYSDTQNVNCWLAPRNNATNAWNANTGNGNVNTNNVFNRYRCFSASLAPLDLSDDVLLRYLDDEAICYSNKHDSYEAARVHYMSAILYRLVRRILNGTWMQGTSIVFTISYPTYREVWAAEYTDRILHHDVAPDLNDVTENIHSDNNNVSHGNRIGHSALTAARQIQSNMKKFPNGFVGTRDISGFFMSINRRRACNIILDNYLFEKGKLIKKLIMHDPTTNCMKHSADSEFAKIPKNKSLFNAKAGYGLPIGNFYSQLVANAYLKDIDALASSEKWRDRIGYTRFVDDMCVVSSSTKLINEFFKDVEAELNKLELKLNSHKIYLQPIRHGVKFCGYVVHDHGLYLSNRTIYSCIRRVEIEEVSQVGAVRLVQVLNSYYGFLKHCKSQRIQVEIAKMVLAQFNKYINVKRRQNQIIFSIRYRMRYEYESRRFFQGLIHKSKLLYYETWKSDRWRDFSYRNYSRGIRVLYRAGL